jgi:hypothetical protein
MSLSRNVVGMRHVVEVLCTETFTDGRVAKLADLSSKSCISDQQILLVCLTRKPRAGRSSLAFHD